MANLFILLLRKEEGILKWYYLQFFSKDRCSEKLFPSKEPLILFEVDELSTSLKNISLSDITSVLSIIKPSLTPASVNAQKEALELNESSNLPEIVVTETSIIKAPLDPSRQRKVIQQINILSELRKYFVDDKFCDITVHVIDDKIRAHKVVLATGSTIWHNLFDSDQTLTNITINDFDYETVKQLIEYIYTGTAKQATDQLLIAADKYGVNGLKELCEEQLIELINMETIGTVLELAERYKANKLLEEAEKFLKEHPGVQSVRQNF